MANEKPGWLPAILLLFIAILIGGFLISLWYHTEQPIEISLPRTPNLNGNIYITGAVANPGLYPFSAADSLESLLQAAGGASKSANFSNVKLYIASNGTAGPQKIDINRAEPWLLEALPGIGETLAHRIIDYKQQNGLFRSTSDLLKIDGMGTKTFQQIETLITVGD